MFRTSMCPSSGVQVVYCCMCCGCGPKERVCSLVHCV